MGKIILQQYSLNSLIIPITNQSCRNYLYLCNMGRQAAIIVLETSNELNILYKQTKDYKSKLKVKSLIHTKNNKYKTRQELANHLEIGVRTLFDWMQLYKTKGLSAFIISTSGGAHNNVIPSSVKTAIEKKLNNSKEPLQGYKDAVHWVSNNYNIDINYQTLRSFMINKFGTKLKQPRKSHYKKNEIAFETFKKTSQTS